MSKAMKSKAQTVLPFPVLTRPVGVSGGKGSIKAEIRGYEKAVDRLIEIDATLEKLTAEGARLRAPVQAAAADARVTLEIQSSTTIKSVLAHGSDQPARFTWKNAFRPVDAVHEPVLRRHLGKHFDSLFERTAQIKLRDTSAAGRNVALAVLQDALGDKFGTLFEAIPEIAAKAELLEKRTVLRPSLTAAQNAALDQIIDQVQHEPSLSLK